MPGSRPTNADIMRELGELSEGMRSVRRELDDAAQSRKVMYDKIDDQNKSIREIEFKVDTSAQVSAQAREEIKNLRTELKPIADIKGDLPELVEGWNDLRKTGRRLVWLLSIGGLSVVSGLMWFGDLVVQSARNWLGLPPPGG